MKQDWRLQHILSIDQFARDDLEQVIAVADLMEPIASRRYSTRVLEGAVLANLFFEASTRTRISFHTAFARLGGAVCDTSSVVFSSISKGESLADTARVIAGYCDAIVIRHPDVGSAQEFANHVNIPVLNAGDGIGEHPSQALLDLYTIYKERMHRNNKPIDHCRVALVGDLKRGRTVHSLIRALSHFDDMEFVCVAPDSLQMPDDLVRKAKEAGHKVTICTDLQPGLATADVVYATRLQTERNDQGDTQTGYAPDFRITRKIINDVCGHDVIIMHPLPRDSRKNANDLSDELDGDPRNAIFRQADNGIAVRMAMFALTLGVVDQIKGDTHPSRWLQPAHWRRWE
ncbi:MAG: aspartate carbamoyltransferase [Pseudomonadota bacterium]